MPIRAACPAIGLRCNSPGDRLLKNRSDHQGEIPLDAQVSDPLATIHLVAKAFGPGNAAGEDVERAANAFGTKVDNNGVVIGFGGANEASSKSEVKGDVDSPDGVLFSCIFDKNRLKDTTLAIAIAYAGSQIADIRAPSRPRNRPTSMIWKATPGKRQSCVESPTG